MQSNPVVVFGNCVIMSRLTIRQHAVGMGSGESMASDCPEDFINWHEWHCDMNFFISSLMPGQWKLSVMSACVLFTPM